jgi:GMP synthase-like glutamine amidotransferase
MAPGPIVVVDTEHAGARDSVTVNRLESLRARLGELTGAPVSVKHYLDTNRTGIEGEAAVLSGSRSAWATHDQSELAAFRQRILEFDGRLLGICAGMQLIAAALGGSVDQTASPEHGFVEVELQSNDLFKGLSQEADFYQNHGDEVTEVPETVEVIARNAAYVQAIHVPARGWWGTQFHPELADESHPAGERVLANAARLLYRRTDNLMRQGR